MKKKKIIMMVGTSLFENYMEENKDETNFKHYIEDLKDRSAKEYDNEKERIDFIKKKINEWLVNEIDDKTNASSEIKSLVKLKKELKDDFEIYLLSSDTILSRLAGEILKEEFNKIQNLATCEVNQSPIDDLQVKNRKQFVEGMCNLINKIYNIANYDWENIIINITGGYKATIPYLTVFAQVNRCPIYYIFEETDALIRIPYIPLDINWRIFEKNEKFFMDLESEVIKEIPSDIPYEEKEDIESLIERDNNLISLNPLGIALWEKYKEGYERFYISEIVNEYKEKNKERKKIIDKSFIELKRRLEKYPGDDDLNHSLKGIELPSGFKNFKHKEENLQVRILYKTIEFTTRYNRVGRKIYIGLIAIGTEVHNAESEYVKYFNNNKSKVNDTENYKTYRIEKEV